MDEWTVPMMRKINQFVIVNIFVAYWPFTSLMQLLNSGIP